MTPVSKDTNLYGTEYTVANKLSDRCVHKQDIVLVYHAPYVREYIEFAMS
ncbi:MAG: hypothetical protein DCF19_01800 [Pseudanabaena frigida]|uniref:Uncharacterized protein n=1 Tax=Pseudanabaena frigida TaxID=945775 RepID=A0A2W4WS17_9CYAN|nr:MAG: hypothetical protein DCF19_01800 [Pseudanabaena frigida]